MEWQEYNEGIEIQNGDILAIDNGEIMGHVTNLDQETHYGLLVQQESYGNNIAHHVLIEADLVNKASTGIEMGRITHYSKGGFPSGGVLIRPK